MTLMELELDRSIQHNNNMETAPGFILWSYSLLNNDIYRTSVPSIEKRKFSIQLVYSCNCCSMDLLGQIYGSKFLVKEAKEIYADYQKKLADLNSLEF